MRAWSIVVGLMVVLGACATRGTAGSSAEGARTTSTTARLNIITPAELNEHRHLASAADIVRQLRPNWRAGTIFIDNDVSPVPLSGISSSRIKEIRFLTASEAQMKWGSRHREVIQVITR